MKKRKAYDAKNADAAANATAVRCALRVLRDLFLFMKTKGRSRRFPSKLAKKSRERQIHYYDRPSCSLQA